MFTVYGLNGRIFSGPLEGLRELGPVQAVARLRAVAPVKPQADDIEPSLILAGRAPDNPSPGLTEPRQRDALAAYAQAAQTLAAPRHPLTDVAALMSRRVVSVPLAASVAQAQALLVQAGIGQAPVLDVQRRLVGLLLRADLLPLPTDLETAETWAAWREHPIAGLMWTPVPSVHADTPIRQVAQVLLDLRLPGLPVLDDAGVLEGFVSRGDILRALTREPPLDLWT